MPISRSDCSTSKCSSGHGDRCDGVRASYVLCKFMTVCAAISCNVRTDPSYFSASMTDLPKFSEKLILRCSAGALGCYVYSYALDLKPTFLDKHCKKLQRQTLHHASLRFLAGRLPASPLTFFEFTIEPAAPAATERNRLRNPTIILQYGKVRIIAVCG